MRVSSFLVPLAAGLASAGPCTVYYQDGECLPTAECAEQGKVSTPNFCPNDPADVQCCTAPPNPEIPENNCQPHVVEAGKTILKEKPNIAHVVWCYANKPGEHGKGLALDFMVGPYNPKGQELAEYVMDNYKRFNVMYIIWGQKIWNPSRDGDPKPWEQWRQMEDRGDVTNNHWDHPHVSFNAA
ncbi:hypothetical protein VTO42DRAFT_5149 [Malbranchea cinnamomea]